MPTPQEMLLDAVRREELCDLFIGQEDVRDGEMAGWGDDRAVPAEVLRQVLLGEYPGIPEASGVRLRGAVITGDLDLTEQRIPPISLEWCRFDAVCFDHAKFTGHASFDGASFTGNVRFNDAIFSESAQFKNSSFVRHASFGNAKFARAAFFDGATFSASAWFNGATSAMPTRARARMSMSLPRSMRRGSLATPGSNGRHSLAPPSSSALSSPPAHGSRRRPSQIQASSVRRRSPGAL
jgi:Pentapeptide repeats (9 copies)